MVVVVVSDSSDEVYIEVVSQLSDSEVDVASGGVASLILGTPVVGRSDGVEFRRSNLFFVRVWA